MLPAPLEVVYKGLDVDTLAEAYLQIYIIGTSDDPVIAFCADIEYRMEPKSDARTEPRNS